MTQCKCKKSDVIEKIVKEIEDLSDRRMRALLKQGGWVELTEYGFVDLTIGSKDHTCMDQAIYQDGVIEELWDPAKCDFTFDLDEGREMVLSDVEDLVDRLFAQFESEKDDE